MALNQGWIYRDRITSKDAGLTVLAFYSQRYRHSSWADWQTRILMGQVQLDNQSVQPETTLQTGQCLAYHRPPWDEPEVPLTVDVLYLDDDLVVVSKPAGLPVLPGGGFLEHTLLHQLQNRFPKAVPLHRLGRGTSGVLLAARTAQAKAQLSQQWREATKFSEGNCRDCPLHKTYRALIGSAVPCPGQFVIETSIGKIPHPTLDYIYGAHPQGKSARSEVQVLRRRETDTLLQVTIRTGRPHQIRIHLAAAGYPLLGDPLYQIGGIPRIPKNGRHPVPSDLGYHLHAHQLRFVHPRTRQNMVITANPPPLLS